MALKLAHLGVNEIRDIADNCTGCQEGKRYKLQFRKSETATGVVGELIDSDVYGPTDIELLGRSRYFVLFKDDS